jgi:hypothetical protein
MTFRSKTPVWVVLLIVLSLLIALIIALSLQKKVKAPAVPVCGECVAERGRLLVATWATLAASVVLVGLGLVTGGDTGALIVFFAFIGGPVAALVLGAQSQWSARVSAHLDDTGTYLVVRRAAPAFVQAYRQMVAPAPMAAYPPYPPYPGQPPYPQPPTVLPGR